jgi:hypothetical protein
MKNYAFMILFAIFAVPSAASAQTPAADAKAAIPAPAAAAPAASGGAAAATTASHKHHAAHAATTHKKGWRHWWRNRQIERGPRALRPGHHRRLLRRG